jgi:hypothetical protein
MNGLADGAGAAAGPLHPAADRPFSRPPGQLPHAATGLRQGRAASLRDRLRRPLTWPGRRGPASMPPRGRPKPGQPAASTQYRVISQESGSAAQFGVRLMPSQKAIPKRIVGIAFTESLVRDYLE